MSWSPINETVDGRQFQYWSGEPMPLRDLFEHLGKVTGGIDIMKGVYVASPTTVMWDKNPADVEAEEKALLKALKAKYPNV